MKATDQRTRQKALAKGASTHESGLHHVSNADFFNGITALQPRTETGVSFPENMELQSCKFRFVRLHVNAEARTANCKHWFNLAG